MRIVVKQRFSQLALNSSQYLVTTVDKRHREINIRFTTYVLMCVVILFCELSLVCVTLRASYRDWLTNILFPVHRVHYMQLHLDRFSLDRSSKTSVIDQCIYSHLFLLPSCGSRPASVHFRDFSSLIFSQFYLHLFFGQLFRHTTILV